MKKSRFIIPALIGIIGVASIVTIVTLTERSNERSVTSSASQQGRNLEENYGTKFATIGGNDLYIYIFSNGNSYFYSMSHIGSNGRVLRSSGEPPNEIGTENDTYIDLVTKRFYTRLKNGGWTFVGKISDLNNSTPYLGSNGNWWLGEKDTGVKVTGVAQQSAYQLYLETHPGYTKTEDVWLNELISGELDTRITFVVKFDTNGGTSIPNKIVIEGEKIAKPINPAKSGYTFVSWTYNGNVWDFNKTPVTSSMTLVANWSIAKNNLNVLLDETLGNVQIIGEGYTNEDMTVTATPLGTNVFRGWYDGDIKLSSNLTYSFKMPSKDYEITARFQTDEEFHEWADNHGYYPRKIDTNHIEYGLYPQSLVSDEELIEKLKLVHAEEETNFIEYNDELYYSAIAKPSGPTPVFDNGEYIQPGKQYFFKVEKIEWNILKNDTGIYEIQSQKILFPLVFNEAYSGQIGGKYANNYESSNIRQVLNNSFYELAFQTWNTFIDEVEVDNSSSTTGSSDNPYVCDNTFDKVYLASRLQMANNVIFPNNESRIAVPTDYSKALGSYINVNESNGTYYWTRSPTPSTSSSQIVWAIGLDGTETQLSVGTRTFGTRPCINVHDVTID